MFYMDWSQFYSSMIYRSVKKFSQIAVNRKMKMSKSAAPKHLRLHDFIVKRKDKARTHPPVNLKVGKSVSISHQMWNSASIVNWLLKQDQDLLEKSYQELPTHK
jgi:hypothetical protein